MYTPAHFAEGRLEVLHELIRDFAFGSLITTGPGGPEVSLLPMFLDIERNALRCHLAKANPQSRGIDKQKAFVLFQGPAHYVSPNWYPSKREHGKVVPTWNYVAVEVRGICTTFEDSGWLVRHVSELTAQQESAFDNPWQVADAPADYIAGLTRAITGVEIAIESISGKWKLSQNRPQADRDGVVAGLASRNTNRSLDLAALMRKAPND